MAPLILTIDATPGVDTVSLTPTVTGDNDENDYTLRKVNVLVNDISIVSGFVEHPIVFMDLAVDPAVRKSEYLLSREMISIGKSYMVILVYEYEKKDDRTRLVIESEAINITATSVPIALTETTFITRAEDAAVSINLSSYGTVGSAADGYSEITEITVYIAKVGSILATDFIVKKLSPTWTNDSYDQWLLVLDKDNFDPELANDKKYEIAAVLRNVVGSTTLGPTKLFTPADVPAQLDQVLALHSFHDPYTIATSSTPFINVYFSKPEDFDSLVVSQKPVSNYTIYAQEKEQLFDVSGDPADWGDLGDPISLSIPNGPSIPTIVDGVTTWTSGTTGFELEVPLVVNLITYSYMYSILIDSSTLGKVYEYYVQPENANGLSPASPVSEQVAHYASPDIQEFVIHHVTEANTKTGTVVNSTTGELEFVIDALADLNGGDDIPLGPHPTTGARNSFLKLEVYDNENVQTSILSRDVEFSQKYTAVTVGSVTTHILEDEWTASSNIITRPDDITLKIDCTPIDTPIPGAINDNLINVYYHLFESGDPVKFTAAAGTSIVGLMDGITYYASVQGPHTILLYAEPELTTLKVISGTGGDDDTLTWSPLHNNRIKSVAHRLTPGHQLSYTNLAAAAEPAGVAATASATAAATATANAATATAAAATANAASFSAVARNAVKKALDDVATALNTVAAAATAAKEALNTAGNTTAGTAAENAAAAATIAAGTATTAAGTATNAANAGDLAAAAGALDTAAGHLDTAAGHLNVAATSAAGNTIGLTQNTVYYAVPDGNYYFKLATTLPNALNGTVIETLLTSGSGLHQFDHLEEGRSSSLADNTGFRDATATVDSSDDSEVKDFNNSSYETTFNSADVDTTENTITISPHSFNNGQEVKYNVGGTVITGLSDAQNYFVIFVDANTIKLADSSDAEINLTDVGTGNHTLTKVLNVNIKIDDHGFLDGDRVEYSDNGSSSISGLNDNEIYSVSKVDEHNINLKTLSSADPIPFTILNPATRTLTKKLFSSILNITNNNTPLVAGDELVYNTTSDGIAVGGLTDGSTYYVIDTDDAAKIKLAASLADATAATPIPIVLTHEGTGNHTLVSLLNDQITINEHGFTSGQAVKYKNGGGDTIAGLTNNTTYYVVIIDTNTIKLAASLADANNGTTVTLTSADVVTHILEFAARSLTSLLVNGNKYLFKLSRLSKDPFSDKITSSLATSIIRTQYRSMDQLQFIEAYSVNKLYEFVKDEQGASAVELAFIQLTEEQMNGMDNFLSAENQLEYSLYQGSVQVPGVASIIHDSLLGPTDVRTFNFTTSVGTRRNMYVRTALTNLETLRLVEGAESSPVKEAIAQDYVSAVLNLRVKQSSQTGFTVKWDPITDPQKLGANSTANIKFDVYVYNDTEPSNAVIIRRISYSATSVDQNEAEFTNLETGHIYTVYVVSSVTYTKNDVDGTSLNAYFTNAMIRKHFASLAVPVVGPPGKPVRVKVHPKYDSISLIYDPPVDNELGGFLVDDLRYHILVTEYSGNLNFPNYMNELDTLVRQQSIANVSGSTEITAFKAYKFENDGTNSANALPITANTPVSVAIWATGSAGGTDLNNIILDLHDDKSTIIFNPSAINSTVPLKTIVGQAYTDPDRYITGTIVDTPVINATVAAGSVTIIIDKPQNPPADILVIVEAEDAISAGATPIEIASFDTRLLRGQVDSANNAFNIEGGMLFFLENLMSNPSIPSKMVDEIEYGKTTDVVEEVDVHTGFDFGVENGKYFLTFRDLVNGQSLSFRVHFITTALGPYDILSDPAVIIAAAEAPPTEPESVSFDVSTKQINLFWEEPLNSGGAGLGENGLLQYNIKVAKQSVPSDVLVNINTMFLTYELNQITFPGIENGILYEVQISAFYIKDENRVTGNPVEIIAKPNPSPVGPSNVSAVRTGSGQITVKYTNAAAAEQILYPLTNITIQYKKTGTLDAELQTGAINTNIVASDTVTEIINGLIDGQSYEIRIVSNKTYEYAQAPPTKTVLNVKPYGDVEVTIEPDNVNGSGNKKRRVSVQRQGSGPITNIIALGKTNDSNTIVVLNLSLANSNLPIITNSGLPGLTLVANETSVFILDFVALPGPLDQVLVIVNTTFGSDTDIIPTGAGSFWQ